MRKFALYLFGVLILAALAFGAFRSLTSGTRVVQASAPQIWAMNDTEDTTSIVDCNGWASVLWIISVGAADSNTSEVYDSFVLMHGDDAEGDDLAAVTDSRRWYGTMLDADTGTIATVDTADDGNQVYQIEYRPTRGGKRYSAIVVSQVGDHSGDSDGTYISITAIRHHAETSGAAGF